jgi:HSP20 family protein
VVDISENELEYVVKAELPQIPKEDVKVCVRNGVLEISGERKSESEQTGQQFCRVERAYGTFLRSFTLPPGAESQKAQAVLREGVLTVKIPKNPQAAPKALEVKIS